MGLQYMKNPIAEVRRRLNEGWSDVEKSNANLKGHENELKQIYEIYSKKAVEALERYDTLSLFNSSATDYVRFLGRLSTNYQCMYNESHLQNLSLKYQSELYFYFDLLMTPVMQYTDYLKRDVTLRHNEACYHFGIELCEYCLSASKQDIDSMIALKKAGMSDSQILIEFRAMQQESQAKLLREIKQARALSQAQAEPQRAQPTVQPQDNTQVIDQLTQKINLWVEKDDK